MVTYLHASKRKLCSSFNLQRAIWTRRNEKTNSALNPHVLRYEDTKLSKSNKLNNYSTSVNLWLSFVYVFLLPSLLFVQLSHVFFFRKSVKIKMTACDKRTSCSLPMADSVPLRRSKAPDRSLPMRFSRPRWKCVSV